MCKKNSWVLPSNLLMAALNRLCSSDDLQEGKGGLQKSSKSQSCLLLFAIDVNCASVSTWSLGLLRGTLCCNNHGKIVQVSVASQISVNDSFNLVPES